ncbi:hypothetical protein CLF_106465 [Clonorchis sinensis]|uniref:Uncharacterized protein n=1 Tax=Clonorchis sinensis TaxID=79923 RepID=G7YF80_CLOSI|nr:hypothetical protein CLF_106465 [Clonorchis sinensis]
MAKAKPRGDSGIREVLVKTATGFSCLGYTVDDSGFKPGKNRISPSQTGLKEPLSILTALQYYSRFMSKFAEHASCLFGVISSNHFSWSSNHEKTLRELLGLLQTAAVLKPFSTKHHSTVNTDASFTGIGPIIEKSGRPVKPKAFGKHKRTLSTMYLQENLKQAQLSSQYEGPGLVNEVRSKCVNIEVAHRGSVYSFGKLSGNSLDLIAHASRYRQLQTIYFSALLHVLKLMPDYLVIAVRSTFRLLQYECEHECLHADRELCEQRLLSYAKSKRNIWAEVFRAVKRRIVCQVR